MQTARFCYNNSARLWTTLELAIATDFSSSLSLKSKDNKWPRCSNLSENLRRVPKVQCSHLQTHEHVFLLVECFQCFSYISYSWVFHCFSYNYACGCEQVPIWHSDVPTKKFITSIHWVRLAVAGRLTIYIRTYNYMNTFSVHIYGSVYLSHWMKI